MGIEYKYLLLPIVGAVIGWLTNFVAIKLLFRPHKEISFAGVKLQGLIPMRRAEIAKSIAITIEQELLNSEDLAQVLDTLDWKDEVERTVEEVVEHRFGKAGGKGIKKIPVIGLLSENLVYHVKYLLTKEILKQIEKKKSGLVARFKDTINVETLLAERIDNLDIKKFEELLTKLISKELRHIEYLGAAMGFLIGTFQGAIFHFVS
ncbi:MAG: DUF445 family protein [Deltaproteobacteria bacterium]|nr:DUF445 family protein [Deltaproteobacteria bacterium]